MTPAGLSGNKGLQAKGVRARTAVAPRSATPPGNDKESHHRAYHSPDHRRCNPARATRSLRACGLHQNNLSCDWTTQQGNARASPSKAKAAAFLCDPRSSVRAIGVPNLAAPYASSDGIGTTVVSAAHGTPAESEERRGCGQIKKT
jgi:hypothetical protein